MFSPLTRVALPLVRLLERTESGRKGVRVLRAANAVALGFRGERISLRAAALTYVTLFSLVPLASVSLGLAHLIDAGTFEAKLRSVAFTVLAPGIHDDLQTFFDNFLRAAGSSAVGTVGFLVLLISAGTLLKNLDGSLNDLWNVRRRRPFLKRVVLYAAILIMGPVLTAVTLIGSGVAESALQGALPILAPLLLALGPATLVIGALTSLYLYAPNAPVRLRSALSGGIVAGLGWELARHIYAAFAAGAFRYNPLYGALGAAPLFLMWIYVSWLFVLFGARLAYALDAVNLRGLSATHSGHPRARELLAARVVQAATLALLRGETPPLRRELALRLRVADGFLAETLDQLEASGLVELGWQGGVRPAGNPEQLTLADISRAVGGIGAHLDEPSLQEWHQGDFSELQLLFQKADARAMELLRQMTWQELAELPSSAPTERNPVVPEQPARQAAQNR